MRTSKYTFLYYIFFLLIFGCNRNIILEKQKKGENFSQLNISLFEKLITTDSSNLKFKNNIKVHRDELHNTEDYWITVKNDNNFTTYFIDKQNSKIININKDFWNHQYTTRTISNYYPNGNLKNAITFNYSDIYLNSPYFQNISQNKLLVSTFSYTEDKHVDKAIYFENIYKYRLVDLINDLTKYIVDKDLEIQIAMIYSNDFTNHSNLGFFSFENIKNEHPYWGVVYFKNEINKKTLLLFDGINGQLISTQDRVIQISTDDYGGQEQYKFQEYLMEQQHSKQQDSIWNEVNK